MGSIAGVLVAAVLGVLLAAGASTLVVSSQSPSRTELSSPLVVYGSQ